MPKEYFFKMTLLATMVILDESLFLQLNLDLILVQDQTQLSLKLLYLISMKLFTKYFL